MTKQTAIRLPYLLIFVAVILVMVPGIPAIAIGDTAGERFTVTVMGTGMVEEPDPAASRRAAIKDGLAAAVNAAVVAMVPEDVLAANFSELDALFSVNTEAFIMSYTVLAAASPADRQDTYCRALIRAVVPREAIQTEVREAGIFIDQTMPPRVLIAVGQHLGESPPAYWWQKNVLTRIVPMESRMVEKFNKRGIEAVDHADLIHQDVDFETLSPNITDVAAVTLARQLGADFVVAGRLDGIPETGEAGESELWQGQVNVRLLCVETGRQLAAKTAAVATETGGAFMGKMDFLNGAAEKAVHLLSPVIVRVWNSQQQRSRQIELRIQGDGYLSKLGEFRKIFDALPMVKAFQMTEMAIDGAVLLAEVEGDADSLARSLSGQQSERFRVKVLDVTGSRITIALEIFETSL